MNSNLEIKAFGLALLVAALSLGGVLLAAAPIKMLVNSSANQVDADGPVSTLTAGSSSALVESGHQLFIRSCVECHGDDAHGDEGPDLHNLTISNDALTVMIKRGEKNQMPPFAKKYDDVQIAALVAFLRSLRQN